MTFLRSSKRVVSEGVALSDQSGLPCWTQEVRDMLEGMTRFRATHQAPGIDRIFAPAIAYAWEKLEKTEHSSLTALPTDGRRNLENELRAILFCTTGPCLDLHLKAYRAVTRSLFVSIETLEGLKATSLIDRFVGDSVIERLLELFKAFPILPELWSQVIADWCDRTAELLMRLSRDRNLLAKALFSGKSLGRLVDLQTGLSDPHNGGRSVALLKFEAGRVIYKPRDGRGEQEWFALLQWMNLRGFVPTFRTVKLLNRGNYCWMEYVPSVACKNVAAVRRFYRRAGGMLCAAYFFRMVDCHRDNIIAFGEDPVLIDAEAFLHSENRLGSDSSNVLLQTGFLRCNDPISEVNSHALGSSDLGSHLPKLKNKRSRGFKHSAEVVLGFRAAWRVFLGKKSNRAMVRQRFRRLARHKWRRIYRTTRTYAAARDASVQPSALRSGFARTAALNAALPKSKQPSSIFAGEIAALERRDIPYFRRSTKARYQRPNADDLGAALTRIAQVLSQSR